MPITKVTNKDEFDKELENAGGKLVVVDFYADWCGPCKMIAPKIEAMSNGEFSDVIFLKVDVDEAEDVSEDQSISAMPTFRCFKNNALVEELVGASEDKLREMIQKHK